MADLFDFSSPPKSAVELGDEEPEPILVKKRNRTALFLPSDEDDELPTAKRVATGASGNNRPGASESAPEDIDLFFKEAEDDELFGQSTLDAPLDLSALRKRADRENARKSGGSHEIGSFGGDALALGGAGDGTGGGGGGGKEKKPRKPVMKLDEARLLGADGFPRLVEEAKAFKTKGKGHEVSHFAPNRTSIHSHAHYSREKAADLSRLLQIYQFWTHKMYPKTQFRDTVQRVEKLCHSRSMHVRFPFSTTSSWRKPIERGLICRVR